MSPISTQRQAGLAGREARARAHPRGGGGRWSARRTRFLCRRRSAAATDAADAQACLATSRVAEAGHERARRRNSRKTHLDGRGRLDGRTSRRAPAVPVLTWVQPGPRRADGRLGFDAGADLRHRLRDAEFRRRPSWSGFPPRSAPASRWASPRRRMTTASFPAAARRWKRGLASGRDDRARRPRPCSCPI